MFDAWLEQEKGTAKEKCRIGRIMRILLIALMLPMALMQVVLLLDGPAGDLFILNIGALLFIIAVSWYIFSLGSYKRRFIKPLLESVERELPTDADRQEFARQMQSAEHITYAPLPQRKDCDMLIAADYCYDRQPRKSRIIRNREIRKLVLSPDSYTVGRGHLRDCYVLELFTADDEKRPTWKAYFMREDELYGAFTRLQEGIPPEAVIQDDVAYGKTEEGEKKARKKALMDLVIVLISLAILIVLMKFRR